MLLSKWENSLRVELKKADAESVFHCAFAAFNKVKVGGSRIFRSINGHRLVKIHVNTWRQHRPHSLNFMHIFLKATFQLTMCVTMKRLAIRKVFIKNVQKYPYPWSILTFSSYQCTQNHSRSANGRTLQLTHFVFCNASKPKRKTIRGFTCSRQLRAKPPNTPFHFKSIILLHEVFDLPYWFMSECVSITFKLALVNDLGA